jgi:hypothetical protein
MPTSVLKLENQFSLNYLRTIKWGSPIIENANGIYIISTNKDKAYLPKSITNLTFNESQLETWLTNAPNVDLYGLHPSKNRLKEHLNGFWLSDESILYIGKAEKQTLSDRVSQFYNHKVGKKSPHKGGYWFKLLSNTNDAYIHLFSTQDSNKIEELLLMYFIANVSEISKQNLIDKELCLPFANLQLRSGIIKNHGLRNHCQ